uniref:Uncharacterized protein n=1 Tax=Dunaliella tertiolecta TaxID=3047 RepID=A0A7S3VT26_DUNTE|eukprot:1143638-Pelagomonas_calceolata.AAC.6
MHRSCAKESTTGGELTPISMLQREEAGDRSQSRKQGGWEMLTLRGQAPFQTCEIKAFPGCTNVEIRRWQSEGCWPGIQGLITHSARSMIMAFMPCSRQQAREGGALRIDF